MGCFACSRSWCLRIVSQGLIWCRSGGVEECTACRRDTCFVYGEGGQYRNHARVRTPVLAFFYSVFLHNL